MARRRGAVFLAAVLLAGGAVAERHEPTPDESAAIERLFDAYRDSQARELNGEQRDNESQSESDAGESQSENGADDSRTLTMETLARIRGAVRERVMKEVVAVLEREELPAFGDGAVTVYEFSDYRCGYCRRVFPFLDAAVERGEVRIKVVELPVLGPQSLDMARAALAAWKQNKYAEYHRTLMRTPPPQTKEELVRFAAGVGIDEDALAAAADDEQTEQMLENNFRIAALVGVRGTPAFIINNRFIAGALSEEDFLKLIRGE